MLLIAFLDKAAEALLALAVGAVHQPVVAVIATKAAHHTHTHIYIYTHTHNINIYI